QKQEHRKAMSLLKRKAYKIIIKTRHLIHIFKSHSQCLVIISINPPFYPFQWIIKITIIITNQHYKRTLSISMDNLKIITLSFFTWIFGTEIITEHYSSTFV